MDEERRAFHRWHASLMEPWDGPAALIFTDGVAVGAALDRNGLRPLRYWVSDAGLVVCASEAGVIDVPSGRIRRGKLGPGQMIVVDPRRGGLDDDAIRSVAEEKPWSAWAERYRIARLPEMPRAEHAREDELLTRQLLHGYTREDLTLMLRPAAAHGKEPTFSMGDDAPIAALSRHDRSLFNHVRQRFAQVTNPAMDHLRERSVMSLGVLLGPRAPLLCDDPDAAALEELESFFQWERPAGWTRRGVCVAAPPVSELRFDASRPKRLPPRPTESRSSW
jgi:glutamate synthase (NADPH/NADH) large chain